MDIKHISDALMQMMSQFEQIAGVAATEKGGPQETSIFDFFSGLSQKGEYPGEEVENLLTKIERISAQIAETDNEALKAELTKTLTLLNQALAAVLRQTVSGTYTTPTE